MHTIAKLSAVLAALDKTPSSYSGGLPGELDKKIGLIHWICSKVDVPRQEREYRLGSVLDGARSSASILLLMNCGCIQETYLVMLVMILQEGGEDR
jgi:hypothetical protein